MALLWQRLHCTSEVPLKLWYIFYKLPYNMHIAHKPITTVRHLLTNVKNKDRLEDRQGAVLYKIKCCDCQTTYICETGRNLSTRLIEHKWVTRNGDVNNHIAEHHLQVKHQIDWDSATCITYSTDYYQRPTLESWFTNLEQMPLNCSQQLPAPNKRLLTDSNKTDNDRMTDKRQFDSINDCPTVTKRWIKMNQWHLRVFLANNITA